MENASSHPCGGLFVFKNKQTNKDMNDKKVALVALIIALVLVGVFYAVIRSGTSSNNTASGGIDSSVACQSYDYSRWSHCSQDGGQTRVLTAAYPSGCKIGTETTQGQSCGYVPLQLDASNILKTMVQQIKSAPDRSIVSDFISGQDGSSVSTVRWMMSDDDNLFLWHIVKDRQTGAITESVMLRDTNQDLIPDIFSKNATDWLRIDSQPKTLQEQLRLLSAFDMAYFGGYLLNY